MFTVTRYVVKLKAENAGELLPLHSTEQLGETYPDRESAIVQLRKLYEDFLDYLPIADHFDREDGYFTATCFGIPVIGSVEKVPIALTSAELSKAGEAYMSVLKAEDCRNAIYSFAGYDPDADEKDADNLRAAYDFVNRYGMLIGDVAEGTTEKMEQLRKDIIERFDKIFDTHFNPYSLWEEAIRQVLDEYVKAQNPCRKQVSSEKK